MGQSSRRRRRSMGQSRHRMGQSRKCLGQPVLGRTNVTNAITYNIPASLVAAFRGRKVIVRAADPSEIVDRLAVETLGDISYIRLLSLDGEIDRLMAWGDEVPVELSVSDPHRDLPLLYRYAPLLAGHPIRVSVPLVPGFSNVVKLAVSLNFAVKMDGGQPKESLADEMQRIAGFYLHQTTVSEPIEFFHSLFLAFYHQDPVNLWTIQEEDPSLFRYITDRGEETMPGRLAGVVDNQGFTTFVRVLRNGLAAEEGECSGCEFLIYCMGYFKWPDREYRCDTVKALLHTLLSAAGELRSDIASCQSLGGGERT